MPPAVDSDDLALRRFLQRVWNNDVGPLLRDARGPQRAKTARSAGTLAGATGLFLDSVMGLKGRPFTRFMTVVGASLGAMVPDVWDWRWVREAADETQRAAVEEAVQAEAAKLPESEALELFGLAELAPRAALKEAWRAALQRWHPDKARDEITRREHHVRFLAYKTAYELLCRAYDEGRLPRP